jgi:transposase
MSVMPKAFPLESRRDVVAVARKGEVPLSQVARDLGISACLHRWLRLADREDRVGSGVAGQESVELREARKRVRQLEQENEILRRAAAYFARDLNPKWPTTRPSGSGGGDRLRAASVGVHDQAGGRAKNANSCP